MTPAIETIQNIAKCTAAEATRVYRYYVKEHILRVDKVNGSWSVVHGAFLDKDVIERAIEQSAL